MTVDRHIRRPALALVPNAVEEYMDELQSMILAERIGLET